MYTPIVPLKTIPDSKVLVYLFSDQKDPKTIPFGKGHTLMAYIMT